MKESYTFFNQESIFTNGKTKWLYLITFRADLFKTGFIFDRLSKYKRNINLKKTCLLRETLCDTNPLKHRNFRGKCISPFLNCTFFFLPFCPACTFCESMECFVPACSNAGWRQSVALENVQDHHRYARLVLYSLPTALQTVHFKWVALHSVSWPY